MRAWLIIDKEEKGPPQHGDWFIPNESYCGDRFINKPAQSLIDFTTNWPLAECVELKIPAEFIANIRELFERKE